MKSKVSSFVAIFFLITGCGNKIDIVSNHLLPNEQTTPEMGIGYQLDAPPAELASIGLTGLATMSDNYQKASITLIENSGNETYYVLPANSIYNINDPNDDYPETKSLDFTSGIKGFEFEIDLPEQTLDGDNNNSNDGTYQLSGNFFPYSDIEILTGQLRVTANSGSYYVSLDWGGQNILAESYSYSQLPQKISFEFNSQTSTFKVYFDGVNKTLTNNNYTPEKLGVGFLLGQENLSSPNAGKIASIRLITLAQDMTTTFSSGTTDYLGNAMKYPNLQY